MDEMVPCVYLATRRTDLLAIEAVTRACDALSLRVRHWAGEQPDAAPPSVVVSGLGTGERAIPPEIARLLSEVAPEARLLLLASEPLIEPVIRLEGGRVMLLSPPVSSERIELALGEVMTRADTPALSISSQQRLQPRWWLARLAIGHATTNEHLPACRDVPAEGLTAILGMPSTPVVFQKAAAVITSLASAHDKAQALTPIFRDRGSLIHLSPGGDAWTFYWPTSSMLWLLSPMRLPTRWDLAGALRKTPHVRFLTLPARPDDIVVAADVALGDDDRTPPTPDDGPQVLAWLEQRLAGRSSPAAAVVAMVRR